MPPFPPAPPLVAPPKQSSYRNARESELEQLRQRGLAKLLNKHFTSVTLSIAEERAAAEAALRDLEARKAAGTKDWSDVLNQEGGELSVYDKLYLELQQKKAECRRKEKETLLLYQRYVAKFGETGAVQAPANPQNGSFPPLSPRDTAGDSPQASRVPFLADQIESNLSKHTSSGADRHPSIQSLGKDRTHQQVFSTMDEKQRVEYLRTLEGRGVDAYSSTPTVEDSKRKTVGRSDARVGFFDTPQGSSSPSFMGKWTHNDTPVSQLTAATGGTDSPMASSVQSETALGFDDDEVKSTISELTSVHSLIISDAEVRLVEFLKTETATIKQLLDHEEETIAGSVRSSYSSEVGSTHARAADQAEDMVHQMQKILHSFQQEQLATSTTSYVGASREPRPFHTGNPDEEWTVYFDETYQREYYHERNSNKTQWTPPLTDETTTVISDYTTPRTARGTATLSHLEVMPEHSTNVYGKRTSRREEYRRKRRKRRKRRQALLFLFVVLFVGGCYHVMQNHPDAVPRLAAKVIDVDESMSSLRSFLRESILSGQSGPEIRGEAWSKKQRKSKQSVTKEKKESELQAREEYERIARDIARAQEEARMEVNRHEAERAASEKKERKSRRLRSILQVMLQAPRPV